MSPFVPASPKWSLLLRSSNPKAVCVTGVPQVCCTCIKVGYITQTTVAGLVQPWTDGKGVILSCVKLKGRIWSLIYTVEVTKSHAVCLCPRNIAHYGRHLVRFHFSSAVLCNANTIHHGDSVVTLQLQCDLSHLLQKVFTVHKGNGLVPCLAATRTLSSDCAFWMEGS
jgi:hypothetical protein